MQKVVRLKHLGIHESGENLLASFETETGVADLLFDLRTLETVINDLTAALSRPEIRQHQATSGLFAAAAPRRTRVAPTADGKTILLSFQMQNGLEHHFALPIPDAQTLGVQLQHKASRQKTSSARRGH